jgi:hypothetical protein
MYSLFFLETRGLYVVHIRLSYCLTILCCILGVLKKLFEPAMKGSGDGKVGEYLVTYNVELLLLCACSLLVGLLTLFYCYYVSLFMTTCRVLVQAFHPLATKI